MEEELDVNRRELVNAHRVNYLVNNSDKPLNPKPSLSGNEKSTVWIYDPASGSINKREAPSPLVMQPYTSLFVVEESQSHDPSQGQTK